MPVEYYFDFCFSVIHLLFEIMKYDDFSFVIKLFLKVDLAILGLLWFYINRRITVSIPLKNFFGILCVTFNM